MTAAAVARVAAEEVARVIVGVAIFAATVASAATMLVLL